MINCVDGDFFEGLADFSHGDIYSKQYHPNIDLLNNLNLNRTPILFINTERLLLLLNIVKEYKKDVIIISHNSDLTLNETIIPYIPPNVIRLWCQNYDGVDNDIIKPLPIGLERKRWFPEERKQEVLFEYSKKTLEKEYLVYMNFNPNTNLERNDWYNYFKDKNYVHVEMLGNGNKFINYIDKVKKSKFVLSPRGNGIDCHRNWECLSVGTIPIIKKTNFANNIFKDLPVLLIDEYSEINENYLNDFIKYNNSNYDKISREYWEKLIKQDIKIYE